MSEVLLEIRGKVDVKSLPSNHLAEIFTAEVSSDAHDELYLAYQFLNMVGVNTTYLGTKYNLSPNTMSKLNKGLTPLRKNRDYLYHAFLHELDFCWSATHSSLISEVMLEVARLHVKLPKNQKLWAFLQLA